MAIVGAFIVLGVALGLLGLPSFLSAFFVSAVLPFPLLGTQKSSEIATLTFAGALVAVLAACRHQLGATKAPDWSSLAVFVLSYLLFYLLSLTWTDFDGTAERMRDLAVLGAAYRDPINFQEPWLSGTKIVYYTFWYSWARIFGVLFAVPHRELYHQVAAFAPSFLLTSSFVALRAGANLSLRLSLVGAVAITIGGNLASLPGLWSPEVDTWWAPSRVIKGGINEFPAWSFLLGDIHPHYLSLGLAPYFVAVGIYLGRLAHRESLLLPFALIGGSIAIAIIWNANLWEVPVTALLLSAVVLLAIWEKSFCAQELYRAGQLTLCVGIAILVLLFCINAGGIWVLPGAVCFALLIFAAVMGAKGLASFQRSSFSGPLLGAVVLSLVVVFAIGAITAAGATRSRGSDIALHFVASNNQSSAKEFFQVWGIQWTILLLGALFVSRNYLQLLAVILGGLSIFVSQRAGAPITLFSASLLFLLLSSPLSVVERRGLAIALVGIITSAVGEFVFFDDPYGGEFERMNTIFKFTSAAWVPWTAGSLVFFLSAVGRNFGSWWRRWAQAAAAGTCALVMTASTYFFWYTAFLLRPKTCALFAGFWSQANEVRRTGCLPNRDGLDLIEKTYPGVRETVLALEKEPPGVVLESFGDPYSLTTHVATLANKPSYLGWSNHVNVYTGLYGEVTRRENVITAIYNASEPCLVKRARLLKAGVRYLVVGPLEVERFANALSVDLSCLKALSTAGRYAVYSADTNATESDTARQM